jgi:hypothetical protein
MTDKKPFWTPFLLTMLLVNAILWPALAIKRSIDVNTCLVAEGKYLDETDWESCGYSP